MSLVIKLNVSVNSDLPKVNPFSLSDIMGNPVLDKSKVIDMWKFGSGVSSLRGLINNTQATLKGSSTWLDDAVLIDTDYLNRLDLGVAGSQNISFMALVTMPSLSGAGLEMLIGNFSGTTVPTNPSTGSGIYLNPSSNAGKVGNDGFIINTQGSVTQYKGSSLNDGSTDLTGSVVVGKKITLGHAVGYALADGAKFLSYARLKGDRTIYKNAVTNSRAPRPGNNICVGNAGFIGSTAAVSPLQVHAAIVYNEYADSAMMENLRAALLSL